MLDLKRTWTKFKFNVQQGRVVELGLLATKSVFFRPKMPVSGIIGVSVILGVLVAFRFRPKLSFLVSLI